MAAAMLGCCLAGALSLAMSVAAVAATAPSQQKKPAAAKAAPKPAAAKAPTPPQATAAAIQNVRLIADPAETERLRDREFALDRQHAQMLMAVSMANDAAQRAAASTERLLLPLWIFAVGSIAACLLLLWNLIESRKTTRSARESVKELTRLDKEARFSFQKSPAAAKAQKLAPTLDRPEAGDAPVAVE
ncbi:hypothetical protein [Hydrocarboniphaga sp.]|uniref:hypothetical protein n=1 Tax=Hydrocarboniphaga sp. TaxID=2033016 RepID=UPI002613A254|nr:hypothetical protein [Hydrocarboniphaga sp.]